MRRPDVAIDRCEIERLSSAYDHCLHTYHGVTPWNPGATHLVYYGIDEDDDRGHVVVRDLKTDDERVVGRSDSRNFHTAAGQRWCFGGESVIYRSGGRLHVVDVDNPGDRRTLDALAGFNLRTVLPDGVHATGSWGSSDGREARIARVNLETEASETLVTVDETLNELPSELRTPDADWYFNHPVFDAEETVLFYKLMRDPPYSEADGRHPWLNGTNWAAFFVKDVESGEVRCLSDTVSGHPFWLDDGRHVLNVAYPYDGSDNRWLVLMDAETGAVDRLVDQPIEGPGHPSQSPDGRWIAMNGFTADGDAAPVYVFDGERGGCREIARLDHRFAGGSHRGDLLGGQPHPVWSPDGRELLVNHNQGGERMTLCLLTDFLP